MARNRYNRTSSKQSSVQEQNLAEKRRKAEEEKKRQEEEKKRQEEERQRQIDSQKSQERESINSALSLAEDGLDDVTSKLSLVYNILCEDILLDNVGFRTEEIQNIKNQISLINK